MILRYGIMPPPVNQVHRTKVLKQHFKGCQQNGKGRTQQASSRLGYGGNPKKGNW